MATYQVPGWNGWFEEFVVLERGQGFTTTVALAFASHGAHSPLPR